LAVGGGRNLWGEIGASRAGDDGHPLRVLDLATGSGDVPRISRIARRASGSRFTSTAATSRSRPSTKATQVARRREGRRAAAPLLRARRPAIRCRRITT
jgi:hypothetical protein